MESIKGEVGRAHRLGITLRNLNDQGLNLPLTMGGSLNLIAGLVLIAATMMMVEDFSPWTIGWGVIFILTVVATVWPGAIMEYHWDQWDHHVTYLFRTIGIVATTLVGYLMIGAAILVSQSDDWLWMTWAVIAINVIIANKDIRKSLFEPAYLAGLFVILELFTIWLIWFTQAPWATIIMVVALVCIFIYAARWAILNADG